MSVSSGFSGAHWGVCCRERDQIVYCQFWFWFYHDLPSLVGTSHWAWIQHSCSTLLKYAMICITWISWIKLSRLNVCVCVHSQHIERNASFMNQAQYWHKHPAPTSEQVNQAEMKFMGRMLPVVQQESKTDPARVQARDFYWWCTRRFLWRVSSTPASIFFWEKSFTLYLPGLPLWSLIVYRLHSRKVKFPSCICTSADTVSEMWNDRRITAHLHSVPCAETT